MVKIQAVLVAIGVLSCGFAWDTRAQPVTSGVKDARAVLIGPGGKTYVAMKDAVVAVDNGQTKPFLTGFKDVRGLAAFQQSLFVCEASQVQKLDAAGKATVVVADVPATAWSFTCITANQETGQVYVLDDGSRRGQSPRLYRLSGRGDPAVVFEWPRSSKAGAPCGMLCDGASHMLFVTSAGELQRLRLADSLLEKLDASPTLSGPMAWDYFGRLYLGDAVAGKIFVINRPGEKPVALPQGFGKLVSLCLTPRGKELLALDAKSGTITPIPIGDPDAPVDESPLPLEPTIAFPKLTWTGWKAETDRGKVNPLRPIMLTHAGDGSNRVFVGIQQGVIHVFRNDQAATNTKVFLDIQDRVRYNDETNEEGFLGLAFHPKYRKNGEFFVFYTPKSVRNTNFVSRFKVSKDDPNRADPESEEILMSFKKPFWNHDGGTLRFGPDGYLYLTHGDGGLANDPYENGQNLKSLLGKVHRIDIDHKDAGLNYAIPKDNPFVGKADARPEIWAYGLRNIWRMAFDRKTGQLWAADVGQNLFEEIDLIERGGNYGWNLREGLHPFGKKGTGPRADLVEPIWEYHHDIGKSITGGGVYRGSRLRELDGHYLYADYVSGRIWGLKYDAEKKRVVANRPIKDSGVPIFSFGEDEQGEMYLLTATPTGQGIFWLKRQ